MLFPAPRQPARADRLQAVSRADRGADQRADLGVRAAARRHRLCPPPLRADRPVGAVLDAESSPARRGARPVVVARARRGPGARATGGRSRVFGLVGAALVGELVVHRARAARRRRASASSSRALGARAVAQPPASWGSGRSISSSRRRSRRRSAQWRTRSCPAIAVLGLHAWWVLRTDAAFEDAAIEASAERARRIEAMRSRRSMAYPRRATAAQHRRCASRRSAIPAIAIFWKNILCLRRTAQLRLLIGPAVMAIAFGAALSSDARRLSRRPVATSALTLAGLLLVFGGRLIRNDLRQDMQHLPLLKTLPVAPGDIDARRSRVGGAADGRAAARRCSSSRTSPLR